MRFKQVQTDLHHCYRTAKSVACTTPETKRCWAPANKTCQQFFVHSSYVPFQGIETHRKGLISSISRGSR